MHVRLAEIDGSLTRRSVLRETKAAGRFFNDSEHIKEIDRKQRNRQAISDTRAKLQNTQAKQIKAQHFFQQLSRDINKPKFAKSRYTGENSSVSSQSRTRIHPMYGSNPYTKGGS